MLEWHKKNRKETYQRRKAQIETVVVVDEIPDLSKAWGDTPQLFTVAPKLDAIQTPGFNPFL